MIVYAGTGTRDVNRNTTRIMDHRFVARFYYSQAGDIARDAAAVQRWTTVLVDQLRGAVQFGGTVPSVTRASVDGYSIGYLRFADKDYAGVELQVGVTTSEPWQAVA